MSRQGVCQVVIISEQLRRVQLSHDWRCCSMGLLVGVFEGLCSPAMLMIVPGNCDLDRLMSGCMLYARVARCWASELSKHMLQPAGPAGPSYCCCQLVGRLLLPAFFSSWRRWFVAYQHSNLLSCPI
jgi:hypothetical protein